MKSLIILLIITTSAFAKEEFLPQWMTEEEILQSEKIGETQRITLPSQQKIRMPAEFEKRAGILITWSSYCQSIQRDMVEGIIQKCKAYIVVENSWEQSDVENYLISGGVFLDSVVFVILPTNSVWIRDYGPWFIYEETTGRSIVDPGYNRPRPDDDALPSNLGDLWDIPTYGLPLLHPGGNFMVDGRGTGFSSQLVYQENSNFTELEIDSIMYEYLGLEQFIVVPRIHQEYTGHIDIFAKLLNDTLILVADTPEGDINHNLLNEIADSLSVISNIPGHPYVVQRIPMPPLSGGTGPTYLNSLLVNNTVLLPTYNLTLDTTAERIYHELLPNYDIVTIDCSNMVGSGGAIHCISMGVAYNDTTPPEITHTPIEDMYLEDWPCTVSASIIDDMEVDSTFLYYRKNGINMGMVPLVLGEDGYYKGTFKMRVGQGDMVSYNMQAFDRAFNESWLPVDGYFSFVIIPETYVEHQTPDTFYLSQNYPNPFSIRTVIRYSLFVNGDKTSRLTPYALRIYDLTGRLVHTIPLPSSLITHHSSVIWDGRDANGHILPSGIYLYRLTAEGYDFTRKMYLVH